MACKYTYKGVEYTEDEFRKVLKSMPQQELGKYLSTSITPSAPFVTSTDAWVELGLKQAIRMAAQGGYDRIAWTTGEQQNERYDLSKRVEEIHYYPRDNSLHVFYVGSDPRTGSDLDRTVTPEELPDVIGKEAAERLLAAPNENGIQRLYGEGLKVGGSGMKGFYDKILPTVAKKVSKRLGGGGVAEDIGISTGINEMEVIDHFDDVPEDVLNKERDKARALDITQQQSISITPEMRQRVSMGVPLMQRPKAVPVEKWNAMVPTIREALKSGATPEQVMQQLGEFTKGLNQSQKGAIQGKIQQAYDKIEAARSKESPEKAERLFDRLVSFGVRQFHARGGNLDMPSFRAAIIRNYKSISNDVSDADLSEIYAEAQRSYDAGLSDTVRTKKTIEDVTGVSAERPRVTMTERQFYAQKIKDIAFGFDFGFARAAFSERAKGRKEGMKEQAAADRAAERQRKAEREALRKEFIDHINTYLNEIKGELTATQARVIAGAAADVNTPAKARSFVDLVYQVMADVTLAEKISEAEKLRKAIKKGLKKSAQKRRDVYLNELAKDFASLRIPKTALDDYISMATAIKDLIRGASVAVSEQSVDALRTDAGVTNEQIEQYIQQQQQAQQALDEQEMLEEFEQKRIEMGLEGASLTLDDIRSLMNSFAAEEQQQEALEAKMKAEQKLQMLRTMSRLKLEELSEHLKSQELDKDKKQIVANLKLIDLDRLSAKDAVFLIGMVNNIVKNDRWGGARTFSEKGPADKAIIQMAGVAKKIRKGMISVGASGSLWNQTDIIATFLEKLFGEYAAKMRKETGIDGLINSYSEANRIADQIREARDKYAKSVGYKDTELNRYRAGAYAYLQQVSGESQEQQQASFERRRQDLLDSAALALFPASRKRGIRFPELYAQAVQEVAEPARSLGEVKVDEPIRKMVEWEQRRHAEDYHTHAQAAELDHNTRMGSERNYTATRQMRSGVIRTAQAAQRANKELETRLESALYSGRNVNERVAGSKMERTGRSEDQMVDLDFFSVQDRARKELYLDTLGSRYIARIREILSDPRLTGGDAPIMDVDSRDLIEARVKSILGADRITEALIDEKFTNLYLKFAKRSAGIALKGVGQWLKQPSVWVSTITVLGKDAPLLAQGIMDASKTHEEGTWQNEIAKTQSIYERSRVIGGIEKVGESIARRAVLKGTEGTAKEKLKLFSHGAGVFADNLSKWTIGMPDSIAATATWWAFYRQYIRKAGLQNTDWQSELNEDAAAYATQQQERMQGANIPEANAPLYRNPGQWKKIILDTLFAFNSFNLNNMKRAVRDLDMLLTGSSDAKKMAARDLAGRYMEALTFVLIGQLLTQMGLAAADAALAAAGDDPEDDRRRREAERAKKLPMMQEAMARATLDFVITGLPDIASNRIKEGLNAAWNTMEGDTGPRKRNYDLFFVPKEDSYGVLGAAFGELDNLIRTIEVARKNRGDSERAEVLRREAEFSALLSVAALMGLSDQTFTRAVEREIARRLPYPEMKLRSKYNIMASWLSDMDERTPVDTYENY